MSEELKPEVLETVNETLDVAQEASQETVEETVEKEEVKEEAKEVVEEVKEEVKEVVEEAKEAVVNFNEKTLAELSGLFQELTESADRMKRSKEAEAIKSAFYKRLSREKAEAGEDATVDEPDADTVEEVAATEPLTSAPVSPFAAIEAGFKSLYNTFKKERAEYNRQLDAEREGNLVKKQAIIEDLKALVDEQGDMKDAFPKFREIQNRWRETGPVPQQNFRDVVRGEVLRPRADQPRTPRPGFPQEPRGQDRVLRAGRGPRRERGCRGRLQGAPEAARAVEGVRPRGQGIPPSAPPLPSSTRSTRPISKA